MKSNYKYIIFFTVCVAFFVFIESIRPVPVNWSISFSKNDKIPYGNYILFDKIDLLFRNKKIMVSTSSFSEFYNNNNQFKNKKFNLIVINDVFNPDKLDTESLIKFIKNGNNVFIAAKYYRGKFAKRLSLSTDFLFLKEKDIKINFTDKNLNNKGYIFKKRKANYYFSKYIKKNSRILGKNEKNRPNFIKLKMGKGNIYLSSAPFAFTNFNILDKKNYEYIFKAISYLPVANTIWDEYYKPAIATPRTPLRFILSRESLRWSYYLFLVSIILFVIVYSRRRERVIPIINPLNNDTLEFTKIIGKLYYDRSNHKDIALKKILYFNENLRGGHNITAKNIMEQKYELISVKTGVDYSVVHELFEFIQEIKVKDKISGTELFRLNRLMEKF